MNERKRIQSALTNTAHLTGDVYVQHLRDAALMRLDSLTERVYRISVGGGQATVFTDKAMATRMAVNLATLWEEIVVERIDMTERELEEIVGMKGRALRFVGSGPSSCSIIVPDIEKAPSLLSAWLDSGITVTIDRVQHAPPSPLFDSVSGLDFARALPPKE